jgi:hypothetical protein
MLLDDENGKPITRSNPLPTQESSTDATGAVQPTGGTGIRGWLSGIYITLLTAGIKVATLPSLVLAAGTAIIGKVGIDPANNLVTLSGSKAEVASAQDTQIATTAVTYTKSAGASQIEVYVESGYIRVRTDGEACTSTTGEPIAAGFGSAWQVDSISIFYVQESIVTVVSR